MALNSAFIAAAALRHNWQLIKQRYPDNPVLAMIKANGYGHGALEVAKVLSAADAFGVATMDEALYLRAQGIANEITVMSGFIGASDLDSAIANDLSVVIYHDAQLEKLFGHTPSPPLKIWLKLDTGMHRLGFLPSQWTDVFERCEESHQVEVLGVMTHFACSDDKASLMTAQQFQRYSDGIKGLSYPLSVSNSGALMYHSDKIGPSDWLRPGGLLYGASSSDNSEVDDQGFLPVMTLQSQVIALKTIPKGATVGYGATWVAQRETQLAVVAIGYGDGYPRQAPSGTPVLIRGQCCSLVGRVSMDLITVDVTDLREVSMGDQVILWGEGLSVNAVAHHCGLLSYEMLCQVTERVPRVYVEEGE